MANYDAAFDELMRIEGGHVNDSADPGGDTYWGISERWSRETFEVHVGSWPPKDIKQAKDFYVVLWSRWKMEEFSDRLSEVIFPFVVNLDWDDVGPALQRAAMAATNQPVVVDGDVGPNTRRVVRLADEGRLIAALRSEIAAVYRYEKAAGAKKKFLRGWESAAYGLR